jgi:RNA polymerase sigma factor for flagellar operon FliA
LLRAVETYDPARMTLFTTYCRRRVMGAVLDWVRGCDCLPRSVRRFERACRHARDLVHGVYGRWPDDAELAALIGLPPARFACLARRSAVGAAIPFSTLESCRRGGGTITFSSGELRDRGASDPARNAARSLLAESLTRGFSQVERGVIVLYYFAGLTMAEVGATLKLSEARISQIHRDVLQRLRQRYGERLRDELLA